MGTASIPRRRVELEFPADALPRYGYAGDPWLSMFWHGLSLLFPEGEKFFVESVKRHRRHVTDPALAARVADFAVQEAMHGRQHRAFNALLDAREIDGRRQVEAEVRWILAVARRVLSPRGQLAATAALEHLTAILAEQLLADEAQVAQLADGPMRHLWLWHALEECEHKAVAFDVYRAAGGGEALRLAVMALATAIFALELAAVHLRLLAAAGALGSARGWARGLWTLWGRPGLLRRIAPAYLAWYRPGVHPDDRDTRELVERWRTRLFGPGGPLAHVRVDPPAPAGA